MKNRTIVALLSVIAVLLALNLLPGHRAVVANGPLIGACCLQDGTCIDTTSAECGNTPDAVAFHGDTTCAEVTCIPQLGPCCLPSGKCLEMITKSVCEKLPGGVFNGVGNNCDSPGVNCEPLGACCNPALSSCTLIPEPNCDSLGGIWKGVGTDCLDNDFNGNADDCENTCPADLDTDGEVGIIDFLILLQLWGPCK